MGTFSVAKPVKVSAEANVAANEAVVDAIADLTIEATGDVTLPGAIVLADAVGSGHANYANALAVVQLSADGDVDVSHSGLFAQANANAPLASSYDTADAIINVFAGHDVFVAGNVDAIAVSLSNHSGNFANALINIEAGASGSGSLTMIISNIEALALADPMNDHALAGVTLNAEDNILVVGEDPIADAFAGTVGAFLQTHFTTNLKHSGASSSVASAFIHIRSVDGTITFVPLNNDQEGALRALASDQPNTNSGSLTAIKLLINDLDCGVLGSAGTPQGQGEACAKTAFDIGEADTGP